MLPNQKAPEVGVSPEICRRDLQKLRIQAVGFLWVAGRLSDARESQNDIGTRGNLCLNGRKLPACGGDFAMCQLIEN